MKSPSRFAAVILMAVLPAVMLDSQSTGTLTQTVSKRNTIGTLTASPTTGVNVGTTVNFSYQLSTAGAPSPTTETIQFYDGASPIGAPAAITMGGASNLLPYSQINTSNSWTTVGTAPTVTPVNANGPDGSTNTATTLILPNTASGVAYAVPGTSYANQPLAFSVWVNGTVGNIINLGIADSPHVAASQTTPVSLVGGWQRVQLDYTFPSEAGTGFAVTITSGSASTQTITAFGGQVEQAAAAGPYVSTIGTARPTGAQAGAATLSWNAFLDGSHTVTAQYAGDTNFVGSTSGGVTFIDSKGTPTVTIAASPVSAAVYGTALTLTATVTDPITTPTQTVTFVNGATTIGTCTLISGTCSITLTGTTALPIGAYSFVAQYSGDPNFLAANSSTLPYTITQAPATDLIVAISSSLNPSTYGDVITYTVTVTSSTGVVGADTATVTDTTKSTTLGTCTLASGTCSVTVPATSPGLFTAGSHAISATVADPNFQ